MAGAGVVAARSLFGRRRGGGGPRRDSSKRLSTQLKFKSGGSRTKTKRRRRPKVGGGDGHLDIRKSHVNIWLSRPKKLYKPLGRWNYTQQNYNICISGRGQQGVSTLVGHLTMSQFLTSTGTQPSSTQFYTNIFALNPYQATTGGVLGAVAAPTEDKVHVHKVFTEMQMANASSEPAQVVLYFMIATKDTAQAPDAEWNTCLTQYALGQASASNTAFGGTLPVTPETVGYPTYATYGQTPMNNPSFRKQFKILRVKNYMMASGSVEKLTYCVNVNRTYDRVALARQNALGSLSMPGATVYVMIVVRGTPVAVQTAGGTTVAVTPGSAEIMTTISHTYTFSSLGGSRLPYNRVDPEFVSGVSGGTIVKLMGELNAAVTEANV